MSILEDKKKMRLLMKQSGLNIHDKLARSVLLRKKVFLNQYYINANVFMSFNSLLDEVSMKELNEIIAEKNQLFLPRINGCDIEVVEYTGKWKQEAKYGIWEPLGPCLKDFSVIDVIFVPGVAFDNKNNRLGRGKAYYDRFLPKTRARKIGVCFVEQFVEALPINKLDVLMDEVLCV